MEKMTIIYDAKCKHCKHFARKSAGRKVRHSCTVTGDSLTLKSRICIKFEL